LLMLKKNLKMSQEKNGSEFQRQSREAVQGRKLKDIHLHPIHLLNQQELTGII